MGVAAQVASGSLDLGDVRGPVVLADDDGRLRFVSEEARTLFVRFSIPEQPARLPPELWRALDATPVGQALEWRPSSATVAVLELSRYRVGASWLVLLREVSMQHAALSRKLHRQRLEVTGRLVASIAHELRNSVSSIVYSADLLQSRDALPRDAFDDSVLAIMEASRRLQATVDGLLDYARLGPTVSLPVSLREVLTRAQGFVGPFYRSGKHHMRVALAPEADWVQGNSIVVEQVFVNLLLNAAEASTAPVTVQVTSEHASHPSTGRPMVRVRVADDGPGVAAGLRSRIFEPFVTTRERGTGLGLTNSREAVESLGGAIVLAEVERGATFVVYLPPGTPP